MKKIRALTKDEFCFYKDKKVIFHPLAPEGREALLGQCKKAGDISEVRCPFCEQGFIKFTSVMPWEFRGCELEKVSDAFRYACEHCGIKFQTIMWNWEKIKWGEEKGK